MADRKGTQMEEPKAPLYLANENGEVPILFAAVNRAVARVMELERELRIARNEERRLRKELHDATRQQEL